MVSEGVDIPRLRVGVFATTTTTELFFRQAVGRLVRWEVVGGPEEWIGTEVRFDIRQDGDWTIVLFRHEGWREPVEFMSHCSTKWATYLVSLKQLLETGTGAPDPRDLLVSDWH